MGKLCAAVHLVGFITEPALVRQILEHVNERKTAPAIAPVHSPPLAMNRRRLAALEGVFEAIPELEFDQTVNLAAEAGLSPMKRARPVLLAGRALFYNPSSSARGLGLRHPYWVRFNCRIWLGAGVSAAAAFEAADCAHVHIAVQLDLAG